MWSQSPIYNLQIWKIRNYQNVMSNLLTCQIRTLISTWQAWRILFTSVSYHVLKHGDFFLGHNLLYCGLKQDILLSFVAFDKICRREMRAGAKLRFQHIFREMRASGAKKRDQSGCKTDNSLRFQPHFLAPSNPFPVLFCVDISPASNSLYLAHTFFPLFLFLVIPLFFPFLIFCFLCSFTPFSRFCLIFLQICLTSLKDFEMSLKNFLIISLFVFWFVAWLFLPV